MNLKASIRFLVIVSAMICGCDDSDIREKHKVKTGAEVLIGSHLEELRGRSVGLVMNPTARIGETHMLDTLLALDVNIAALFAPEHGFRGEAGAGEVIEGGIDQATGLSVHSLYGAVKKPDGEMLNGVDLLLFDMQDVGARFYTYGSTLGSVLEAASEFDVPVWVLDRPNPAGGDYISGWIMEEQFASFVGRYPIPVAHGLTLGELGKMMIGESWIEFETPPELRVIPMEGWHRSMRWPDTGLRWVPPSPNLPTFEHALAYLGTCFAEGTTLSEGRGTEDPFLMLGSPTTVFTESDLDALRENLSGSRISQVEFTPVSIPGRAVNPKHEGELSFGLKVEITDADRFDPVDTGLHLLTFLMLHTEDADITPYIYRLAGSEEVGYLGRMVEKRTEAASVWWHFDTASFRAQRRPYLIYE